VPSYQAEQCHKPGDNNIKSHGHENLSSEFVSFIVTRRVYFSLVHSKRKCECFSFSLTYAMQKYTLMGFQMHLVLTAALDGRQLLGLHFGHITLTVRLLE
jgi:hypothetical protein